MFRLRKPPSLSKGIFIQKLSPHFSSISRMDLSNCALRTEGTDWIMQTRDLKNAVLS